MNLTNEVSSGHRDWKDLDRYFSGDLGSVEEMELEEHLSDCAKCTELARRVQRLSYAWKGWTAESHGAAALPDWVAQQLLRAAESVPPRIRSRLHKWSEQWAGSAAGAVRLIVGTKDKASRFITEGLESLSAPAAPFAAFTLASERGRAIAESDDIAVKAGAEGSGATARISLIKGDLAVVINRWPDEAAPIVVLVSENPRQSPLVEKAEWDSKSRSWRARMAAVPSGDYIVVLSPPAEG